MTKPRDPEALLSAYLVDGMEVLPDRVADAVLDEVHRTRQRATPGTWGIRTMSRTTLAAALVVAMVALAGASFVIQGGLPALVGPTASASASPSQPAVVVAPSPTPTTTPSPTPPPILWTQASLKEDWPAPVRAEPAGSPILVPILVKESVAGRYLDPLGDTGTDVLPWVDIRAVTVTDYVYIHRISSPPSSVVPTEQWIAYGVVFDDDRDGVPDWRYGMDNRPGAKDEVGQATRAWRTDLHTGRTESTPPYYNGVAGVLLDTYWDYSDESATFVFGGEVAGGGTAGKRLDVPFYVWASVIQDGRVVATDYAPDVGWLDPGSGPQGERSSDPTPSPGPTPQVVEDPDVPGGRLWTVPVVNNSARPATFVVAEMTATGRAGRPVGTVTPSMVPAGATTDVTFALPAEGSSGWSIFANPGPDTGPMFMGSDVPLAGEIRIDADGNVGWLSP